MTPISPRSFSNSSVISNNSQPENELLDTWPKLEPYEEQKHPNIKSIFSLANSHPQNEEITISVELESNSHPQNEEITISVALKSGDFATARQLFLTMCPHVNESIKSEHAEDIIDFLLSRTSPEPSKIKEFLVYLIKDKAFKTAKMVFDKFVGQKKFAEAKIAFPYFEDTEKAKMAKIIIDELIKQNKFMEALPFFEYLAPEDKIIYAKTIIDKLIEQNKFTETLPFFEYLAPEDKAKNSEYIIDKLILITGTNHTTDDFAPFFKHVSKENKLDYAQKIAVHLIRQNQFAQAELFFKQLGIIDINVKTIISNLTKSSSCIDFVPFFKSLSGENKLKYVQEIIDYLITKDKYTHIIDFIPLLSLNNLLKIINSILPTNAPATPNLNGLNTQSPQYKKLLIDYTTSLMLVTCEHIKDINKAIVLAYCAHKIVVSSIPKSTDLSPTNQIWESFAGAWPTKQFHSHLLNLLEQAKQADESIKQQINGAYNKHPQSKHKPSCAVC